MDIKELSENSTSNKRIKTNRKEVDIDSLLFFMFLFHYLYFKKLYYISLGVSVMNEDMRCTDSREEGGE